MMLVSVVDAIGKPPSGLMNYRLLWLGDYDECVKIEASVNKSGVMTVPYKGRYCKASFKIAETPVMLQQRLLNTIWRELFRNQLYTPRSYPAPGQIYTFIIKKKTQIKTKSYF